VQHIHMLSSKRDMSKVHTVSSDLAGWEPWQGGARSIQWTRHLRVKDRWGLPHSENGNCFAHFI